MKSMWLVIGALCTLLFISRLHAATPASAPVALQPGDVLEIDLREFFSPPKAYVQKCQLNQDGDAKVLFIGPIHVAGMTPDAAARAIDSAAVAGHLLTPATAGNPSRTPVSLATPVARAIPPQTKLATGDLLEVHAFEFQTPAEDFVARLRVNELGQITMRNIGAVPASGLTTAQLEDKIAQAAVATHLIIPKSRSNPGPQVFVIIQEKAAGDPLALLTIGVGDILHITCFELVIPGMDYVIDAQVNQLGNIKLQNIGTLPVAGLKTSQVQAKIAAAAVEGEFLRPGGPGSPGPQVTVEILKKGPGGPTAPLPKIKAGDTLHLNIFELTTPGLEYSGDHVVTDKGSIDVPNLGTIDVAGIDTTQLDEKLSALLVSRKLIIPKGPGSPGPYVSITLTPHP